MDISEMVLAMLANKEISIEDKEAIKGKYSSAGIPIEKLNDIYNMLVDSLTDPGTNRLSKFVYCKNRSCAECGFSFKDASIAGSDDICDMTYNLMRLIHYKHLTIGRD